MMLLYSAGMFQSNFGCKFTSFLFVSPFSVEGLKSHEVNETLVFGSNWRFQLDMLSSFVFLILHFHCLMQRCWGSNFLNQGILVVLFASLYLCTTDFQSHWASTSCKKMLLTFIFLFYHMLSQEFSSLQDSETIKVNNIGSFRLHQA